jgi:hypothetical protein
MDYEDVKLVTGRPPEKTVNDLVKEVDELNLLSGCDCGNCNCGNKE